MQTKKHIMENPAFNQENQVKGRKALARLKEIIRQDKDWVIIHIDSPGYPNGIDNLSIMIVPTDPVAPNTKGKHEVVINPGSHD